MPAAVRLETCSLTWMFFRSQRTVPWEQPSQAGDLALVPGGDQAQHCISI
jgi:hypothetical protein